MNEYSAQNSSINISFIAQATDMFQTVEKHHSFQKATAYAIKFYLCVCVVLALVHVFCM